MIRERSGVSRILSRGDTGWNFRIDLLGRRDDGRPVDDVAMAVLWTT